MGTLQWADSLADFSVKQNCEEILAIALAQRDIKTMLCDTCLSDISMGAKKINSSMSKILQPKTDIAGIIATLLGKFIKP